MITKPIIDGLLKQLTDEWGGRTDVARPGSDLRGVRPRVFRAN